MVEEKQGIITPEKMIREMQRVMMEHMRLSFRQYRELKAQYGTPNRAVSAFMKSVYPLISHDLIDRMNEWIDSQVEMIEKNMEKVIEPEQSTSEDAGTVPGVEEIHKLVNDYMKEAFKQYQELKTLYTTPAKAALEFMKSAYPKDIQDIIENMNKWIQERIDEFESTVKKQIENSEQGMKKKK